MKHVWKRTLAGILTAVMVVTMLPSLAFAASERAGEGGKNAFGFDTSQAPKGFNANDGKNPYGQGKVALNPISELFVATSASGTYQARTYNNYRTGNAPMSGTANTLISRGSQCGDKFVRAVAFDPTGSGKDDHIAYIGIGPDNKAEVWVLNAKTGKQSGDRHLSDQAIGWIGDVRQWEYFGFVAITAGDFNGDGRDELIAYDVANSSLYKVSYSGSGTPNAQYFDKYSGGGSGKKSAIMMDLAAGDLDRDGKDELAVVRANASDMHGTLYIYDKVDQGAGTWGSRDLATGEYYATQGSSVDIGDVNGDGWLDIVTLSHYTKPSKKDRKVYDSWLLGGAFINNGNGGYNNYSPNYKEMEVLDFVEDGFYNDDPVHQPPALACVAIDGIGNREYIFAAGQAYQIQGNGSWNMNHSWSRYQSSDNGIGSCIIANTWFEDAIAGNFDGNRAGREQVVYTSAYKQKSQSDYWYSVNIMGHNGSNWYDSFNQYVHNERSENHNLFCVLAAPDIDNDTIYLEYKSKSFTWENPRVLSILQSSPYFADLAEGYYDATGGTTFGKGVGSGTGSSSTSSINTGFGVKAGGSFLGMVEAYVETTFTAEWEWEFAREQSTTHSISFEGGAQENNVVVFANPVTLYYYDTYVPSGSGYKKEPMTIAIPEEPQYNLLTLDQYNEAARSMGMARITDDMVHATPGQPSSYYQYGSGEYMALKDKVESKYNFTEVMEGNGVVTREISDEISSSKTQSYSYSMSLETGVEAFGSGISASVGGGFGKGETTFNTSTITRGGSVANLPAGTGSDYGFSWNLVTWSTTVGGQRVPVVGYVLQNVKNPPSLPENFTLTDSSQTSVTLGWDAGVDAADSYVIYQHFVEQNRYVRVGAVPASAAGEGGGFTFQINDLEPGGTYYYAIQAVGGSRQSILSADIPATTQREGSTLSIVQQPTDVKDVAPGDSAQFYVNANGNGILSFQWQVNEPGSGEWKAVPGGTNPRLTLSSLTAEMDGNRYRCEVSQTVSGQLDTIYTKPVSLTLGRTGTSVELSISKESGKAAYTQVTEQTEQVTVPETISVTAGGTAAQYTKYNNSLENPNPEHIYAGEDGKYYVLEGLAGSGDSYTATAAVPLATARSFFATDNAGSNKYENADPDTLRGNVPETYTLDESGTGETYDVYTASKQTADQWDVLTVYKKGDSYYTLQRGEDKDGAENMTVWTNDGYTLEQDYQDEPATETIDGTLYEILTSNGTDLVYRNGGNYYQKNESNTMTPLYVITPDTLTSGEETPKYSAKVGGLVETTKAVTNRVDVPVNGDPVTLTASVTSINDKRTVSGVVEFTILNNSTGSTRTISAQVGNNGQAIAMWTPAEAGVYTITASYSGSSILAPSASTGSTYYASAETALQYVLRPGKGSYTYGEQISWTLKQISGTTESNATGVDPTYTVKCADANGQIVTVELHTATSYTPEGPGKCTITAAVDGQDFPTTVEVSKKPLKVSAKNNESVSANQKPSASDLVFDGWVTGDENKYKGLFTVSSELLDSGAHADGEYTVTPVISSTADQDTVAAFQERYDCTITPGRWRLQSDTVTVTLEAGSNGTIAGKIGDSQTPASETVITISKGTVLRAQATPNGGWNVGRWIVTGANGEDLGDVEYTTYKTSVDNDTLRIYPVRDLKIRVEFSNSLSQVTFSAAGQGGMISAKVGSQVLTSPADVATGSSIVFTAVPDANHVVDHWTVTEGSSPVTQKYPDGSDYSASTFTLENIGASATVQVHFAEKGSPLSVNFQAVNEKGRPAAGAVITATETKADGTTAQVSSGGTVTKGSRLDLSISGLTASAAVKEWTSENKVVAGGQTTYTVYNVQGTVDLKAVITDGGTAQRTLTFSVTNEEGQPVPTLQSQLTARSGSASLTSGTAQTPGIPVSFTYTETDQYEVIRWTLKEGNGDVQTVATGRSALTYQLASGLLYNTTVQVVVKEKPVVTVTDVSNGNVKVDYSLNGSPVQPKNGYVYHGTDLTVTLTPDTGHEVEPSIQANYVSESTSDVKTYTIKNVTSDQTITPAWSAIPQYALSYSIVDTGGGEKGTLTASSQRKGMAGYAQSDISNGGKVYRDSAVTLRATPDTGCRVREWTVNGEVLPSIATTQTLTMDEAKSVTIQFMEVGNKVTIQARESGSITSANVAGTDQMGNLESGFILNQGATVTITAAPDPGYEVDHWLVNGERMEDSEGANSFRYTTAVDGVGGAITVTFRQVTYPITWGGANGSVTAGGQTNGEEIRGGTQLVFTAVPNNGYTVSGWRVNGELQNGQTGSTFTWIVPNGRAESPAVTSYDIQAIFTRGSYTVTVVQPANGSIEADRDLSEPITGGTRITFTAKPADGHTLSRWIVNGETVSSGGNTYSCMIEGATEVSAVFVPSQYDISFQAKGGGTVSANGLSASPAKVAYGASITFTAKADPYFFISGWEVDSVLVPDSGSQERFTLENVQAAHSVAAVFAPAVSYEVSYQTDSNGSLSATVNGQPLTLTPGQTGTANGGSKLVFTAAPAENYMVDKWTVNGTEVTRETIASLGLTLDHHLSNILTVSPLRGSLNVQVSFTSYRAYDLPNADSLTGCTITDILCAPEAKNMQIRHGGDLTFTVKPSEGYSTISELTVNGYDCIAGHASGDGLKNCESVTARKNADGSYTVMILGVSGAPTIEVAAHQLMVEHGFANYQIPDSLKDKGIETKDELETALKAQLTAAKDGVVFYDIALKYYDADRNAWVEVSSENFPSNGVDVTLPYPTGSKHGDSFSVSHMLTTGTNAGTVERMNHTTDQNGIHFRVSSLSPFAVSWTKKAENPNPPGGGGGGGAVTTYPVTVEKPQHGKVTASPTSASSGKIVTLTVTPDSGYVLDTLTAADSRGNKIKLTAQSNGRYTFAMPDGEVTVKAVFMDGTQKPCDGGADCPSRSFTDLGGVGTWYHEAVDYALRNNLMSGYGNGLFGPNNNLTRAQLAQILYNREGKPAVTGSSPFTDVANDAWCSDAITWAAANGIVSGYGGGKFGPNDNITREQLAVMLWRYSKSPASTNKELHFNDADEISGYAQDAIRWTVEHGILNGFGDGRLGPKGLATRAQVAQMLKNFIENQEVNP